VPLTWTGVEPGRNGDEERRVRGIRGQGERPGTCGERGRSAWCQPPQTVFVAMAVPVESNRVTVRRGEDARDAKRRQPRSYSPDEECFGAASPRVTKPAIRDCFPFPRGRARRRLPAASEDRRRRRRKALQGRRRSFPLMPLTLAACRSCLRREKGRGPGRQNSGRQRERPGTQSRWPARRCSPQAVLESINTWLLLKSEKLRGVG